MYLFFTCLAPGLIFGQAIGRWGNFFNSEAFGIPTDLPWKLYIPPIHRPIDYVNFEYFHPTFLYESLWNVFCFLLIYFCIIKNDTLPSGYAACSYFILYSVGRFFIEGLRLDSINFVLGFPIAQFVSIVLIFIGLLGMILIRFFPRSNHVA